VGGGRVRARGVVERGGGRVAAFSAGGRAAYVPFLTGATRLFGRDNLDSIQVVATDTDEVETV